MAYYLKWLNLLFNISNNLGTTPFCHVLCLGMHSNVSNVMGRFMVQALQDPAVMSQHRVHCTGYSITHGTGTKTTIIFFANSYAHKHLPPPPPSHLEFISSLFF